MGRPLPPLLASVLDAARVQPALVAAFRVASGGAADVRDVHDVSAELLRRGVVRYTVHAGGPGESCAWHVIGKVYASAEAGERGSAALRWLWAQGFAEREPTSVSIPRVHAYLPELQLLLMEEVPGRTLKQLLASDEAGTEHMRLFAEGLAKLHRSPSAFGAPFTLEEHLKVRCAGLAGPLASAFPELAGAIARIVADARRAAAETLVLAHGDYHPGQVHLHQGRLWILDLDPLHRGDPAYDVAMVLVGLKRLRASPERVRSLRHAFLSAYFTRVDPRSAARLPVNQALIHLKRACKRFRWQDEEGWRDTIPRQIRQAVECLAVAETLRTPRSLDDVAAADERCPGSA